MSRRADRRRFAIVGALAEHGPLPAYDLCMALHRPSGTLDPDLVRLASDGERRAHRELCDQLAAAKQVGRTRPLRAVPKPYGGAA